MNALITVQSTIDYFAQKGSTVGLNLALLDISKAFDKVNFQKLFITLMNRNVNPYFLRLLMSWYGKGTAIVNWNGVFSYRFNLNCGVRQDSVLSRYLFNVYINDVITILNNSGCGCSLFGTYVGCVLYADDIILLSASVTKLQSMISLLKSYLH